MVGTKRRDSCIMYEGEEGEVGEVGEVLLVYASSITTLGRLLYFYEPF